MIDRFAHHGCLSLKSYSPVGWALFFLDTVSDCVQEINTLRKHLTTLVKMNRKKLHYVQSLARGLSVLQAFTAEAPSLSLSNIARMTGMNTTAAQRFTDTLLQLGFLHRNRHREFMLGPKVLDLGFAFLNGSQLKRIAETYLAEFSKKHGRTVNLAVLDGDMIVFLYRREAQRFLKYDLQAGSRLPSYCTATGKVLLAALPDPALRNTLGSMAIEALTRFTITDPEALWVDLMETRKRGYSVCDREMSLALFSLAVPVLNP
ncbi:MAG: IclR family transcriptional regulator C-terminal domain-containing protein, partial [Desulfosarcina sp.]